MTERQITRGQLSILLRRRADDVGGVTQLSRAWKMSRMYIYDVINGERKPGPSILSRLGIEAKTVPAVTIYEMKAPREKSLNTA